MFSDPTKPKILSSIILPDFAHDIYISSSYAYVAAGRAGLKVVDVSNPSSPKEVGYLDTPDLAEGVYVLGSYAYVPDGFAGLRFIDVSNASSPKEVGHYDTPGVAYGIYVSGPYAYVADGDAGLFILALNLFLWCLRGYYCPLPQPYNGSSSLRSPNQDMFNETSAQLFIHRQPCLHAIH